LPVGRLQAAGSSRSETLFCDQVPASRGWRVHAGKVDWTPGQRQIVVKDLCSPASGALTTASQLGSIRSGSDETDCCLTSPNPAPARPDPKHWQRARQGETRRRHGRVSVRRRYSLFLGHKKERKTVKNFRIIRRF